MRIGINARLFKNSNYTGIPGSVYEVLKVWTVKYPQNDYYLFTNKIIDLNIELPSNWKVIYKKGFINQGVFWDELILPRLIKKYKIESFWGTNFALPKRIKNVRYIVSIYDLAAFRIKAVSSRTNMLRLKIVAKRSCYRADDVITVSKATKEDVIDLFHIPPEKITVCYDGGPVFIENNIGEEINKELIFDEPFFLFLSTIEPRKNVETIVHGFEKYLEQSGSNAKLVLAGKIGWLCEDILKAVNTSVYKDHIIMTGFINENEKKYLLQNATAFIFPSLYEGFGIPILEAFKYNLPVITSNVSSMPEVAGDAALYLHNMKDTSEMCKLIQTVVEFPDEQKKILEAKMQKRLSFFSWEKKADRIMSLMLNKR